MREFLILSLTVLHKKSFICFFMTLVVSHDFQVQSETSCDNRYVTVLVAVF